ncbi:helix-turn-helix transcriptional regulator [Oceanimonas sp. CHS3-5]|uniref:helix-turn-helix transcriptional regulator n=1 Tax=Oceanimonas sp. CHS3-5 TaxID=3068186 RepID=UPI003531A889
MKKTLFNFPEAASYIGVSRPTLNRYVKLHRKRKYLQPIRFSQNKVLFKKTQLDMFIQECTC